MQDMIIYDCQANNQSESTFYEICTEFNSQKRLFRGQRSELQC